MEDPFVEIDHSGDIGIEANGKDLPQLVGNLTRGLFSLMYRGAVEATTWVRVKIESPTIEDLVVDWLCEVITVTGTSGRLYSEVDIVRAGDFFVDASLGGEPIDPSRHDLRFDVKAATYHRLLVERSRGVLRARVIFDL